MREPCSTKTRLAKYTSLNFRSMPCHLLWEDRRLNISRVVNIKETETGYNSRELVSVDAKTKQTTVEAWFHDRPIMDCVARTNNACLA